MRKTAFVMLGAALSSVSCGSAGDAGDTVSNGSAISGGTQTTDPTFGEGYFDLEGFPACSMTAINNWWVATNAHCNWGHTWQPGETCYTPGAGTVAKWGGTRVYDPNAGLSATNPVDYPSQQHDIASICRYPGNGEIGLDQRVDMILMRLATPFSMTGADDDFQMPTWPLASTDLTGQTGTCYGWGGSSTELQYGSIQISSVVAPDTYNGYFRGDRAVYSPAFFEDGDSGSGCWVPYGGVTYLATITNSNPNGESLATDTYSGSDAFGPRLGVREWMDSTMFSSPGNLGFALDSGPGVSTQGKNDLDVFWTDSSNGFRWIRYASGWLDQSPNPQSVGTNPGNATLPPASISWAPGRIDVFTVGSGNLYHVWNNGSWQPWETIGGPGVALAAYPPAVSSWGSGRLDIFATASDGTVRHLWYDESLGGWGGWENLGGAANSGPAAVSWSNGRIDLLVRGPSNAIYHKWYDGGWGPSQTGWESLGASASVGPAIASYKPGRLDAFARDTTTGHLLHRWYEGAWTNQWIDTGMSIPSRPSAVSWGPGRIDVFAKDTNGGLWQTYFPR